MFAPTNEAFLNIPKWANDIPLKELLSFHVARGLIHADEIHNDMLARSILSKRDIRLNIYKVTFTKLMVVGCIMSSLINLPFNDRMEI